MDKNESWQMLYEWTIPRQPGNERQVMERVATDVKAFKLPDRRLEDLKTAVAEATMNAMEHGNHYKAEVPVAIQVLASKTAWPYVFGIREEVNQFRLPGNRTSKPSWPNYSHQGVGDCSSSGIWWMR